MSDQDSHEALLEESAKLAHFMMGLASQPRNPPKGKSADAWRAQRLREIRQDVKLLLDQCPIVMEAVTRKAVLQLVQQGRVTLDGDMVALTRPAKGNAVQ